jgi:hypothetical protein
MRLELEELLGAFYDACADYKNETFLQIKKRVLGGDLWPSKEFEREAKKMFKLARS